MEKKEKEEVEGEKPFRKMKPLPEDERERWEEKKKDEEEEEVVT